MLACKLEGALKCCFDAWREIGGNEDRFHETLPVLFMRPMNAPVLARANFAMRPSMNHGDPSGS